MTNVRFIGIFILTAIATSAMAYPRPGTPRREFRGKIYYYEPIRYYCPVWYAGNGIIATRKTPGVPLWPHGHYNKIY